jgi:HSP90 family molecular chaperone
MANTKMTKKDWFAEIRGIVAEMEREDKADMLAFIDHEVELLSKKKSSTNSKKDKELEELCIKVETALAEFDRPVTITEFMKESTHEVATLSNQKLSALLKKCIETRNTVAKTTDKKKSYFALIRE